MISAASDASFSLYKGAHSSVFSRSNLAEQQIASLSSKGFHSRNTLEVQPSFRNSLLNTVLYCKPHLAIHFCLPSALPGFRAQSPDSQLYVTYPPFCIYIYIYSYIFFVYVSVCFKLIFCNSACNFVLRGCHFWLHL